MAWIARSKSRWTRSNSLRWLMMPALRSIHSRFTSRVNSSQNSLNSTGSMRCVRRPLSTEPQREREPERQIDPEADLRLQRVEALKRHARAGEVILSSGDTGERIDPERRRELNASRDAFEKVVATMMLRSCFWRHRALNLAFECEQRSNGDAAGGSNFSVAK